MHLGFNPMQLGSTSIANDGLIVYGNGRNNNRGCRKGKETGFMKTIIKAEGIYKTFQKEEEILKGIQLEIEENTFTVILGPSGSGKSTLLNIMSGMLKPTAGRVWFRGEEVTSLRESDLAMWKRNHIGNIFQNYLLLENLTVRENIELGKRQAKETQEENLDFDQLVEMLKIKDLLDKFPGQLPEDLANQKAENSGMYTTYSKSDCEIQLDRNKKEMLHQTVGAFDAKQTMFELFDQNGSRIGFPKEGEVVISEHISETYGIRKEDRIRLWIGEKAFDLKVCAIAENAETNWIYMQKEQLNQILGYSEKAYCGILSNAAVLEENAHVVTREEREAMLKRNTVSNQISAVICEVVGCVIGCILLLLAIALNFQSNLSDRKILHLLGYEPKEIRHLLSDVYKPVIFAGFLLMIFPSLGIVKVVLRSLSRQIEEYLHFQTGIWIQAFILAVIFAIYFLIQGLYAGTKEGKENE